MQTRNSANRRPTIGVLVGYQVYHGNLNRYLVSIFRGIRSAARDRDCNVLIACGVSHYMPPHVFRPAWPVPSPSVDFVPVGPRNTDGLLVLLPTAAKERSHCIQRFIAEGLPVVFIGSGEGGPAVCVDHEDGIHQVMAHLVAHGHRSIAFIAGQRTDPGASATRLHAYWTDVQKYDLVSDLNLVAYGYHDYDGGREAMGEILRASVPFTAVLASNDESAMGATQALRERGLLVPQDVAVVGFDDQPEAKAQMPPLSTVRCPLFELGYRALDRLFERIEGKEESSEIVKLPVHFIARRSCGCQSGAEVAQLAADISASSLSTGADPEVQVDPEVQIVQSMAAEVQTEVEKLSSKEVYTLCNRLVSAFSDSLNTVDPVNFYLALDEIVQRVEAVGDHLYAWLKATAVLARNIPVFLEANHQGATTLQVAKMLGRARDVISEGMQRQHILYQVRQAAIARQLSFMNAHFLAAQDEGEILGILGQHVKEMGIPSSAVALYEPEGDDLFAWSTIYSGYGSQLKTEHFVTRQFPPPGLYSEASPFHLALLPLVIDQGKAGFVAFTIDSVTDMEPGAAIVLQLLSALRSIRMYREATEDRRLAEEANRMKSRFLSTVSHELRTPLNLIVGVSELLLQTGAEGHKSPPESYLQDMEWIHASAQHLDGLIRDVLDLARSEVGQLRLICEPLDLMEVFQVVVSVGEQMAQDKGLTWRTEIPASLPMVWGDRTRLRQVIVNLISNAVKFTAYGEVALRVEVKEKSMTITVNDTGLGIPADEQELIFDEFRQSDRATMHGYGGLGLGLAICKRLVELHGGVIGVQSSGEEGAGSTFYFTLPVLDASLAPPGAAQIPTAAGQIVLLLARHSSGGEHLRQHLSRQGFDVQVLCFEETTDWLSRLLSAPPGAIILDIGLASEQGWETLKVLRGNPATQDIPVLFYTLTEERDSGSTLEMDYLTKPVGTVELAQALRRQGLAAGTEEKTILVVDDEPGILEMHARIVQAQPAPYRVLKARDGREALELMGRERPDLVLLDLVMPELDGFGVLEAMQKEETIRNIPVIVLTGQTLTETDMARLNHSVAAVLGKGLFSVEETLAHIEATLVRKRSLGNETQYLVRKAMAYVHEHYSESISRVDVARYVGVNADYLTRCFHKETSVTLVTYLNRYRINQAKILLAAGEKSVAEVATTVGFSDSNYFSQVFRRETGMSPNEYKRS